MKILIVSFDYRPKLGGVATCAFELASALNRHNDIDIHVLAPTSDGDISFDKKNNFPVTRTQLPKVAIKAVFKLAREIKQTAHSFDADIIINMLWMPSGLSSLIYTLFFNSKKIPYYVFAHGVEVIESNFTIKKQIRSLLSPLKRLVFKRAKLVFSVSHFTENLLIKKCKVDKERIKVVYNGVNPRYFLKKQKSPSLLEKYKITTQKILLTISRLDDYKGIDNTIVSLSEIVKTNPNFLYLIGGIGQDYDRLKELIKKYSLEKNIILCGKISEDEIVDYYNLADIFILLSRYDEFTPNFEGFGLVFLEAASCGIPSLAGNSGGIKDAVIHNETGIIVDPINIEAISEQLRQLINDEKLLLSLGKSAYKRAQEKMNWDEMSKRIIENLN